MTRLAQYTTLGLGGAATVLEAPSQADVVALVHEYPGARILGGGSNVVAGDAGVLEPVIRLTAAGHVRHDDQIIVSAGTAWDDFVAQMVAEGRSGIEALSGIPGCVGATPIQNVGAYGQEVAETIAGMRVLVRRTGEITTWPAARAQFGYRSSFFKEHPGEYVVMAVAFDLPEGLSAPVKYAELAGLLQVEIGPSGRRFWNCAEARGWCSIQPPPTRAAPAPSSPTRSWITHPRARPDGRSRTAG